MSDLTHLAGELADKHDVPEPEMWGFLADAEALGMSETGARDAAVKEYEDAL